MIDAPVEVCVQVSERLTVWPRNCAAVPVPPVTVPLNCSEILPLELGPLGTIATEEMLVKVNWRPRVPAVSVNGAIGPAVVFKVKMLNVAAAPSVSPASAKAAGVVVPLINSVVGMFLVAVPAVILPVLTV